MTTQPHTPETADKPLVVLPVTMADIMTQIEAEKVQRANLRPGNKAAVFAALAGAGIATVTVTFDGSSDSGQIESIDSRDATGIEMPLPEATVSIVAIVWGHSRSEPRSMSVREGIEHLAYDALEETHDGWEINEGAYGEFVFDVPALEIRLDYNERIAATEYYAHTF